MSNKPFPFTIGADPEFTILIGNRRVNAGSFIPNLFEKSKYTKNDMGYNIGEQANIGWDGCSSTGEIRPAPSPYPSEVVKNLGVGFKALTENLSIFDLNTTSKRASIGGHIHFLIQPDNTSNHNRQIHRCLAAFYLPLLLADDVVDLNMRTKTGQSYGNINDFRVEPHGGVTTFEFRVPSAEWLTTPKTAEATLTYLATVYNEIIKDPRAFSNKYKDIVWTKEEQATALQNMILSSYIGPIENVFKKIQKAVKTFEYYEENKTMIDYCFRPKTVLADKEKVGYNIVNGWSLQGKAPTKRQILNNKIANQKAKGVNLDLFSETVTVYTNPETNIEVFANELKKRVLAYNWKLQNSYFLFGMRSGIKDFLVFNKAMEKIYDGGQLDTVMDVQSAEETFHRMDGRFPTENIGSSAETSKGKKNHIMIGIPYDMRQSISLKPFVKLIYDIETGNLNAEAMKKSQLKDDTASTATKGLVYQAYQVAQTRNKEPMVEDAANGNYHAEIAERTADTFRTSINSKLTNHLCAE
jgi:hypothetical protein